MTLVDCDCRVVLINDAALGLVQRSRDEVVELSAGRPIVDEDPALDRKWRQLLQTNELAAEHVVAHRRGTPIRVSYAAHGTTVGGRWFALIVGTSARAEPDGSELIGKPEWLGAPSALTAREREVVRRVALGGRTRQIAAELFLSSETVRSHIRNAMVKTNTHTRAQLVAIMLGERTG
jgi:DNA-binding CsgD family transcriptional regulator